MLHDIQGGDIMSWSRHITGQDVNDPDTHHYFRSVATVNDNSTRANGDTRIDSVVYVVVDRTMDGNDYTFIEQFQALDWGNDSDYCWFVDAAIGAGGYGVAGEDMNSVGRAEIPEVPEIPGVVTYELTFISENRKIWGIPVGDGEMTAGLDAGGVAVDIGGGVVGLPYFGHPFTAGEVVRITGTTFYNDEFTLGAGTTANELQVTDAYNAEVFDGTELVVQYIAMPVASGGRMDIDADGNLYHGHGWYAAGSTFMTKVEPDGTKVYDFFDASSASTSSLVNGLKVNSASTYLYIMFDRGRLEKYDLATGGKEWTVQVGSGNGYYMVLDSDDNPYFRGGTTDKITKYSSADGSVVTEYTNTSSTYGVYAVVVDEDMDIVVTGGYKVSANNDDTLWNLIVRTLDDSSGEKIALGGTYADGANWRTYIIPTGCILTHDGYIYVLAWTPTCTLYKIEVVWVGDTLSELVIISEEAGPTHGQGLYVDLWENLVVVNQDTATSQTDVLYFYDFDLNYLSKVDNMYGSMFNTWDAAVGGAWIQGDAVWAGDLGTVTPAVPAIPGVEPNYVDVNDYYISDFANVADIEFCVYADGRPIGVFSVIEDANGTAVLDLGAEYDVVIAGINYFSVYESFPMVIGGRFGTSEGWRTSIRNATVDFYETLGSYVGVTQDASVNWKFSGDDFATRIDPITEIKEAPFLWGTTREPVVYLWVWKPIPFCMRSIDSKLEVRID